MGAVQGRHALADHPPRRRGGGAAALPRDDQPGAVPRRRRRRRPADPALGAGVRVHPVPASSSSSARAAAGDAGADRQLRRGRRGAGGRQRASARRRRRRRRGPRAWSTWRTSTPRSTSWTRREINAGRRGELEDEYRRDVRRRRAQHPVRPLRDCRPTPPIRDEILGIARARCSPIFSTRATSGPRPRAPRVPSVLAERAPGLAPGACARGSRVRRQAERAGHREPAVQSLDEAPALAGEAESARCCGELRATALEPSLAWLPSSPRRRSAKVLEEVADRLAQPHPAEVLRILRSPESEALAAVVALCGRLQLHQAVPGLGETVAHRRPGRAPGRRSRRWPSSARPRRWRSSSKAMEDGDRAVRLAAVRVVGGARLQGRAQAGRGRRARARRSRRWTSPRRWRSSRPTAPSPGAAGLKALSGILLPRGLLRLKEASGDPRLRRHRARARSARREAREILQQAADDKDLVVRNAVSRALAGERARDARRPSRRRSGAAGGPAPPGRARAPARRSTPRSGASSSIRSRTPRCRRRWTTSTTAARALLALESELEIRLAGDFIFVNATRLRLELDNYASFSHILAMLRAFDIGALRVHAAGQPARVADLPEPAAQPVRAGPARRALRGAASSAWTRGRSRGSRSSAPSPGARSRRGAGQGAGQADLLAGRGGHQGRDHRRPAGPRHQRQEGQARRAADRRPGPQQRDLAGRPHHHPRLRRVHVHPLGQRLHLLGGAGQEARASPSSSSTTSAWRRCCTTSARRGCRSTILNKTTGLDEQEWRIMQAHPVARRAHPVRHARRTTSCPTGRSSWRTSTT